MAQIEPRLMKMRTEGIHLSIVWRYALVVIMTITVGDHFAIGQIQGENLAKQVKSAKQITSQNWPIYRGNRELSGVANGRLPRQLSLVWRVKLGDAIRSSAVCDNQHIYVGCDDGQVYAVTFDGKIKWTYATGTKAEPSAVEAPPMVIDGKVFVGDINGFFYAINAATGKLIWKYETDGKIVGSANWTKSPDGQSTWIIVGSHDAILYCFDATTGKKIWTAESDNFINGTPAIIGNRIVYGGCDGIIHVNHVADGKALADIDIGAPIIASVAAEDGRVYVGHHGNEVVSVDLKLKKIEWTYTFRSFAFYGSPAISKQFIVIGGRDKRVHGIDRKTGQKKWRFVSRKRIDSSPLIIGDQLLIGSDDGRLYRLNLADGKEQWNFEIGSPIPASPSFCKNMIIIGAEDGILYAFGSKDKKGDAS